MFKIEKGKPLKVRSKYDWAEPMEVGDSIFVDNTVAEGHLVSQGLTGWGRSKTPIRRFASRMEDGGRRIWRTE